MREDDFGAIVESMGGVRHPASGRD